jgi:hypothetical protein
MKPLLVISMLALAACSSASDFGDGRYDRHSGDTAWRLEETPSGFAVTVRQDLYRFIPHMGSVELNCRREAIALALTEARRRGRPNVELDERLVRSSVGRNGVTGITSCTAMAPVDL